MADIAVIIPVWNRERQLRTALESVFQQTHAVSECVVVDDGSTDDLAASCEFLDQQGCLGNWVRLETNQGVAAARNRGAERTSARWLCFLDSDDQWLPQKIERQLAWHNRHPRVRISQVEERWIRNGVEVRKPEAWQPGEGDLFSEAVERCSISPSAVMIRRDLWEECGGFDERFRVCEDYELWLRIAATEFVGLVDRGTFLVEKLAGHADQLSNFPAMDRHRVAILLRFYAQSETTLSPERRGLLVNTIRRKAAIVAKGAAKRGRGEREKIFDVIAQMPDEPDCNWALQQFEVILEEVSSSEFSCIS